MAKSPHVAGYYFSQMFSFHNVRDVGYTGLQPRSDSKGNSIVHAAFSSFQNGTTTTHPNCHNGADYGPGVSCAVDIIGNYDHTYNLVVQLVQDTTWRGALVDAVTGTSTVIGEWTLPKGSGKLNNANTGFVEYYPWNGKSKADIVCGTLPHSESTFYDPTSTTAGTGNGSVYGIFEYNDAGCKGKTGFSSTKVPGGYNIKVGF
ncbi:hypothetical protein EMPS_07339 [Entomortierella parvispora]|uniref:Uncharacterized protein n=1 Tax=Entomortierella parvispora TaxID=205924 RepID=A0A9P3LY30_9FUNG|nr:hypothetical protein EMPS_07339 [Entomortierella parvispora]